MIKSREKSWNGMHNGTVSGKGFEESRRNRDSHDKRRQKIVAAGLDMNKGYTKKK